MSGSFVPLSVVVVRHYGYPIQRVREKRHVVAWLSGPDNSVYESRPSYIYCDFFTCNGGYRRSIILINCYTNPRPRRLCWAKRPPTAGARLCRTPIAVPSTASRTLACHFLDRDCSPPVYIAHRKFIITHCVFRCSNGAYIFEMYRNELVA